ncbi:MAG: hypothetical protein EOP09_14100 [Proteobacteria bacterium]|nr:MAG: hypothetical protein EOP09_14100 [Pseudomonadota bacterium]
MQAERLPILNAASNACSTGVLITSHADETHLKERCKLENIRLIHKNSLHRAFIHLGAKSRPGQVDAVLIDDDPLVRLFWAQFGRKNGLTIEPFTSGQEFQVRAAEFPKSTRLFIDSSLADGIKGEVISEQFSKMGFERIFLTTGYDPDPSLERPWIKAIFGKSPELEWFK